MSGWQTQPGCLITFGWGHEGLMALGPTVETIVIVDVLRFTTCVSVACSRGALILPYEWGHAGADEFAVAHDAEVAGMREDSMCSWSLSPTDLKSVSAGTRLVLPSPNGSALSFRAAELGVEVVAGCLRNAAAVGSYLAQRLERQQRIAVIASGERWPNDALRPAVEDMFGAGAVIDRLMGATTSLSEDASVEAQSARAGFVDAEPELAQRLASCASGRELIERFGWHDDVETAAEIDADHCVPVLVDGAYTNVIAVCSN